MDEDLRRCCRDRELGLVVLHLLAKRNRKLLDREQRVRAAGGRVVPTLNGHRQEVLEVVRDVHWDARRGLPNDPPRRFGVRSRRRGAKVGDRVNPLEAPDVVPPVAARAVSHHVLLRVVDLVGGALRRAAALGAFL